MRRPNHSLHLGAIAAAALVACGGSDDPLPPAPAPQPVSAATVNGTVAIGAAVEAASVSITDNAGRPVCEQAALASDVDGNFTCTLKEGMAAPFIVVATDPSGGVQPMVSVGTVTPAAGAIAVVNVTPLTTAIVGQLAPDDSALSLVSDPSLLDTGQLEQIKAKVLEQLAPVLAALGIAAGFDPFATPMVAATATRDGDVGDRLIEAVRITSVDGQLAMAPVDQPDAIVQLADANTVAAASVQAPAAVDASATLRRIAQALNACFALPVAERVLAKDDSIPLSAGGPEVTDAAAACDGIVTGDGFLNGGFRAGQYFYALLHDPAMVGASFSAPETMLLLPDADGPGAHRAVVNLRYRDANGTAGSIITVARRLVRDEADVGVAGQWLLDGDQQQVQSSVQPVLLRREQLAPNAGTGTFANAATSRFDTGLNIFVNKDGPGSTGLRAARVTGPGLPAAGVVLTRLNPAICSNQNWMNVRRKDGRTDVASATPSSNDGNRFYLHRSVGLTGSEATTRRPNPFEGSANNTQFVNWAHPLDYGRPAGSSDYIDFGALRAMTSYTIEFFYDGETVARHRYNKRILTPVVPATSAVVQQWVQFDAATRRLLDPTDALAAAADSFTLSWIANPLAETVASGGVYTFGDGRSVNQGAVTVTRGETSAIAVAPISATCGPATQFPALTGDGSSARNIQLRMRTLDASSKDTFTQFN